MVKTPWSQLRPFQSSLQPLDPQTCDRAQPRAAEVSTHPATECRNRAGEPPSQTADLSDRVLSLYYKSLRWGGLLCISRWYSNPENLSKSYNISEPLHVHTHTHTHLFALLY